MVNFFLLILSTLSTITMAVEQRGSVSGDIINPAVMVPVELGGDAISGLVASGHTEETNDQAATAGGPENSAGDRGTIAGDLLPVAADLPIDISGDSVGGAGEGKTLTDSQNTRQSGKGETTGDTLPVVMGGQVQPTNEDVAAVGQEQAQTDPPATT